MKLLVRSVLLILFIINIILASWYVLHGDIFFTSDIGRDFLLLEELDAKKIVLIGPRSSGELYHGPLWSYLNYPAYLVGGGNPVIVGWYWVILAILVTALSFWIGKRMFGTTAGYAYALMVSLYLTFHTRAFGNPHGAMFLLPLWFYCFIGYIKSNNMKFLAAHLFLSGLMTQFQLAVGIPLTILSIAVLGWVIIKRRLYVHLIAFAIIPISLGNFILFDLKHGHILLHKLMDFVTPTAGGGLFDYRMYITNRVWLLFTGTEILRRDPGFRNIALFVLLLVFVFIQLRDKKHRLIYQSFFYFYVGFFVLSFIDKGPILYFHLYPLFLFVFLIFCSFLTSRYKHVFAVLFIIIYLMNLASSIDDVRGAQGFIGQNKYSWKFLSTMATRVFSGGEKELGYFVYSPDILGYDPKYAMHYAAKQSTKKAYSFKKMLVTYLVAAPHPPADPFMLDSWWRINQVRIDKDPEQVIQFDNGYKIEKYVLTPQEQRIYFDPAIDPGLHFR